MNIPTQKRLAMIVGGCLTGLALGNTPILAAAPCRAGNPCAPKQSIKRSNPCRPCMPKKPCAAKNPCAAKSVGRPMGYKPYRGNPEALIKLGAQLFKDTHLSGNGLACDTCHNHYGAYQSSFAEPYPHFVKMAVDQFKMKAVHADEMVQLCMMSPMAAKPLPWDSKELAALTAYVTEQQKGFMKPHQMGAMNPCAAKHPCGAKNPCAAKRPCAAKNPCAAR